MRPVWGQAIPAQTIPDTPPALLQALAPSRVPDTPPALLQALAHSLTPHAPPQPARSKVAGVYVEGLQSTAVGSYEDVQALMEHGLKARTIAATSMNASSSRAHSVFTLVFQQVRARAVRAQ
jgi:hypothetical protein